MMSPIRVQSGNTSRAGRFLHQPMLWLAMSLAILLMLFNPALSWAQQENSRQPSTCLAIAGTPHTVPFVRASATGLNGLFAQSSSNDVLIRYAVHSTYRIESPQGIVIATDFAGNAGSGRLPDVVTMNHAHSTHYTLAPDPSIPHVLRGWGSGDAPASHYLEVGDTLIRNVTTDIYRGGVLIEMDGNSIFIFEIAGLCIGHVGHLHHTLTPEHFAAIGRLDVLMIPVDGGVTMSIEGITELARQFRSSVILPMHWFSSFSLQRFLDNIAPSFPIDVRRESEMSVSLANLPASPTVVVLQPQMGSGLGPGLRDN